MAVSLMEANASRISSPHLFLPRIRNQTTMFALCIAFLIMILDLSTPQSIAAQMTTQMDTIVPTTARTLVGTLVRPFDGCLVGHPSSDDHQDINMDCLLDACTKLKDVMYSMGQDGNARDLASNLKKIEQARSKIPKIHQHSLRSLLEYEKSLGVKLPGGRLKNPSAAVGLLWIRRSVAFQRHMNSILLDKPNLQPTQAALEAYRHELEPYHSWGLQKIYKMAFRSTTPPRSKIMERFLGDKDALSDDQCSECSDESLTIHDLRELLDIWQPLVTRWKAIFESLDLEDTNRA